MRRTLILAGSLLAAGAGPACAQTVLAGPPTVPPAAEATPPAVLAYAELMPAFPGGEEAFRRYLSAKTRYPPEAERLNLSGTVYVRFVVDEEGRIRDVEVVKGIGAGLDEEALRLVRLMPWWTPGRQHGQPVRVQQTLPISFRLR
ncbi:energy transducer TonB [Hymenobacter sp. 5317J-9]|uniref:energy transducer TonB n=1 Tax=Hymenobacter sp. 5317J-9 TaxID=2932250 RepID=UPI001FD6C2DD|nr:energy transducer TonB [Hymenobacter sp. 5317J-9]UOQ96533.1 energy transducer TonB [Hymenobacter sp. 5317J-9]